MAHVDSFQSRLNFLKQSAHLLALHSPTTAAVLGAEHDRLLQHEELDLHAPKKDWDAHRRQVCGACGNLMIPGWSCNISHRHVQAGTGRTNPSRAQKEIVYGCLRCYRETTQPLQTRTPKHVSRFTEPTKPSSAAAHTAKETRADDAKVTKSSNAGSKQRAKARKQSGLQAMLAKSKAQDSSGSKGFGLDLMDLMQ